MLLKRSWGVVKAFMRAIKALMGAIKALMGAIKAFMGLQYDEIIMDVNRIFIQQRLGIRRKSFNQPQAYSTNPFNFF